MDEENPKYAGLLKKMVLAQHNCAGCHVWQKAQQQQRCAPPKKSVINMI
jgi:hypothetical protein